MSNPTDRQAPAKLCDCRILVVDDDELSASVQSQLLQLLGCDASTESDGDRAVARAASEPFDLMLVDLSMPGLNGFEVLHRLRALEAEQGRPPMPLIAVTGFVSPEDRQRCLAAGFVEHLSKPVILSKLQAAIDSALGTPAAGQAPPTDATGSDVERLRATAQRLGQMSPTQERFAPTVTEAFALRSAQLIELLHRAIEEGNRVEAVRHAQALDANAQFLGANRLAAGAADIARCCEANDWPQARQILRDFEQQQQAVLSVLFEVDR